MGEESVTNEEIISTTDAVINNYLVGASTAEAIKPKMAFDGPELRADSLDMVELIMAFEEQFNIEIPDHEAEQVKTVADAHNLIIRLVNGNG